jgi:LPS-assembly protein
MRLRIFSFVLPLFIANLLSGQQPARQENPFLLPTEKTKSDIEISSDGETRREGIEGELFISERNVVIHYSGLTIYCDYSEYNQRTADVVVRGNVRIYRERYAFVCDRAIYNLDTKQLRMADFGGRKIPFQIIGDSLSSVETNEFTIRNGYVSTSDSSKPDYQIRARTIRVYPNDRMILSNATLFVGAVPVFWFPYLYQSLNNQFSYNIAPGYNGNWGAYALTSITFPIQTNTSGTAHIDLRSARGPAIGLDVNYRDKSDSETYGKLELYGIDDLNPNANQTSLDRGPISGQRYRVSYLGRAYLTEDISAVIDFNKLSDRYFMQDFYPGVFSVDPTPDTYFELLKRGEAYTLMALARIQVNNFQETTQRIPEISWEVTRTPLFNSPIFYEATTSAAWLSRRFASGIASKTDINNRDSFFFTDLSNSVFNPDYRTFRFDTFHQLLFPKTYFGWLSIVPRVGIRETYYSKTGTFTEADGSNPLAEGTITHPGPGGTVLPGTGGPHWRLALNAGAEASFKLSRAYEGVQVRWIGLDGLRHVIQPYLNFSWVSTPTLNPRDILPMDRFIASTRLPAIDFPEFTSIDSINHWTVLRLGMRNRLLTRRDNSTLDWLDLDTYFDVNFNNPFAQIPGADYSNVFNRLRFQPVPWLALQIDSQTPILSHGFTEFNTSIDWVINQNVEIRLSDRYLHGSPFFTDSNQVAFTGYLRINENWGFSIYEAYEGHTGTFLEQTYAIHRDLSSWVASFGLDTRNNGAGKQQVGVYVTFTLKDMPRFGLPLHLNVGSALGQ